MTALARNTDPITSHEAAATIDPNRSQTAVLTFAHRYLGDYFTDKALVATYRSTDHELPQLSDSRIRTARHELTVKHQIAHAGYTRPVTGRRESIWQLADNAPAPEQPNLLDLIRESHS